MEEKCEHNTNDIRCGRMISLGGYMVKICNHVNREVCQDELRYIVEFNKKLHPVGTEPMRVSTELAEAILEII